MTTATPSASYRRRKSLKEASLLEGPMMLLRSIRGFSSHRSLVWLACVPVALFGLGIFTFDNQANLEKHIHVLKDFFKDYEDRFSCKASIETGIVNEELDYKANK